MSNKDLEVNFNIVDNFYEKIVKSDRLLEVMQKEL